MSNDSDNFVSFMCGIAITGLLCYSVSTCSHGFEKELNQRDTVCIEAKAKNLDLELCPKQYRLEAKE